MKELMFGQKKIGRKKKDEARGGKGRGEERKTVSGGKAAGARSTADLQSLRPK